MVSRVVSSNPREQREADEWRMLPLQHPRGWVSVPADLSVQSITSVHAWFSPSSVEFEVWEMQFEAAESRTADKDVYQRGDTFVLLKHRKTQQDFLGPSLVARLQP